MMDFVLPEFLQDCDVDSIHEKMLAELPPDIDSTEGGFLWDFTRPTALVAAELLEFYIPETIKLFFPQWSYGVFLDMLAKMARVERKAANCATAKIEINGEPGTVIPAETVFATPSKEDIESIEFETVETCVLDEEGHGEVTVVALVAGPESNVDANTITMMSEPIEGIETVTNPERATGGTAEESDDDLRERIMEANDVMDDSYIGNNADYKRWAESVSGIGTAIVVPEWNGPETVKIVCLDANGEAANQSLFDAVYKYIMQPDSPLERLAPPNVILTVAAPELTKITYVIEGLVLARGYEKDNVINEFKEGLARYYKLVSEDKAVKYNRVHCVLTNTAGVSDFAGLTMNGGTTNIPINIDEYPYTESVTAEEG